MTSRGTAQGRFQRAIAVRWHGRFALEAPGFTIAESQPGARRGRVAAGPGAVWALGELGGAHAAPNVTLRMGRER